ncbi:Aminoglycoside phosphotransferase [Penicillium cf. griseofulvum]|uniref:Aminoglycoside phosphotransferase n=1 Tax=Penicillium cf. griseofulvum TaxID=2972120 RepID=A0A9W9MPQ8_9EURO|nr:Aminoglycoside phosphotransferase [Penicillium cf. griseofulvum]KAJ5437626.1 Aminoglycoside phosphotransferase [Penicillium cf. griseofulvum]KAJ5441763.1 Aminoglycoside phosphotransferase [Penicillium cf. griseofulvum]
MNPYITNPDNIPPSDLYADLPFYGRYLPKPDDFRIDVQHINSQSTGSLEYWASVVDLCNEAVRIYPADEGGRDVFALGRVIIKSSHLHRAEYTEIDYSYADANEVQAIAIAKNVLKDVKVPDIYFNGKIKDRQVLVQERLPGVALAIAWPYLSQHQKESFKQQARAILQQLHSIKPDGQIRSYIVPDPGILTNGRIQRLEYDILFSDTNTDPDINFMHNDLNISNYIVDDDKIVGLIDWEMAGFFGWNTAKEVHRKARPYDDPVWKDLYDQDALDN